MIIYSDKIDIIYRFMSVKGVGVVQTNRFILSVLQTDKLNGIEQHIKCFLNTSQISEFEQKDSITKNLSTKYPIKFISIIDRDYPSELKDCLKTNTPSMLSYIGNLELLKKKKVGFSGSRKVSDKGIDITKDCVEQLVKEGVSIVSGYAKGVDLMAHHTALTNGGTTIIILPEGINSFSIKKELKSVWDWDKVLVISEFKPTDKWMASRAMQRNNTIIGLSDVVVVIEAGETGGSLNAGEKTIQLGRYLFVPLYGIIPESALGNNLLINKGAFPIKMNKETLKPNLLKILELLKEATKYSLF